MTCERYDRDLALYVEGDLPQQEAARLEHHLQECPRCQGFLRALEDSQRELKALASEAIEAGALFEVRERVLAVVGGPTCRRGMPTRRSHPSRRAWSLALAAGLGVVALGLAFVWRTRPTAPRPITGLVAASPTAHSGPVPAHPPVQSPAAAAALRPPEGATAPPSGHRSTVRPVRAVSQDMEPGAARPVPTLSLEDADQLAKAVVAVSRIRRLSDRPTSPPLAAFSRVALVRLETPDPSVVIYWQLDSNGG